MSEAGFECFICGFKAENVTVAEASKIAAAHKHPEPDVEGYLERQMVGETEHYMNKVTAIAAARDRHEREAADWQRWCHAAEAQRDEAISILRDGEQWAIQADDPKWWGRVGAFLKQFEDKP